MKKNILLTLSACSVALLAEAKALGIPDNDLLFIWTENDKAIDLSPEEKDIAIGKDAIVCALFKTGAAKALRKEHNSYLGIRRANDGSQNNSFSCAGGLNGELVFNRAEPGSNIGATVITGDYDLLTAPEGVTKMITLNEIANALDANKTVGITILRTPEAEAYDIIAVSVYDSSTETYRDYAVGMKIAGSSDTGTFDQVNFYKQRFGNGYTLIGKDYDVKDVLDVTHAVILGQLIPEPATATLSLLALTGLSLRRRR